MLLQESLFGTNRQALGRALLPAVEYWLGMACRKGDLPRRSELDVRELAALLPGCRLIEAAPASAAQGSRLRYRELGGFSVEVPGRDVTEEMRGLDWLDCDIAELALATRSPVGRRCPVPGGAEGDAGADYDGENGCALEALALPFAPAPGPGDPARLAPILLVILAPDRRWR